jgi:hypothetical protein
MQKILGVLKFQPILRLAIRKFGIVLFGGAFRWLLMTYGMQRGFEVLWAVGCKFSGDEGLAVFKAV